MSVQYLNTGVCVVELSNVGTVSKHRCVCVVELSNVSTVSEHRCVCVI